MLHQDVRSHELKLTPIGVPGRNNRVRIEIVATDSLLR
jgi:hypothetical protein